MTRRQQKRLLGLALAVVVSLVATYVNSRSLPTSVLGRVAPGYYQVIDVADGDTISIDMHGKTERVRLIGVDTPETHDPRKAVQCFGQAASDFTKQLIDGQPVRLTTDELSTNRDRYNRLLRYVYLPDGRLLQEEIVKQGYGFAYTSFPFTKAEAFKQLETTARDQKLGLWNTCEPTANEHGGYTSNSE